MDGISQLRAATEWAATLMDNVDASQFDDPTTCDEWDVRGLANHLAGCAHLFAGSFTEPDDASAEAGHGDETTDFLGAGAGADAGAAFRTAADAMYGAFDGPARLEETATLPFGSLPGAVAAFIATQEMLVHGWDLARSTGQDMSGAPQDVAAAVLAAAIAQDGESPEANHFWGTTTTAPDDAPALDRLAAYRGRQV